MLNVKKAMLIACQNNHLDIVKFMVNQGFQLNQNTVWKKSPLYIACEYGNIELASYLIGRFEIDVNFQCEDSHKTALFISAEKGYI
jgi:ankyrin repeat protein